MKASEHRRRWVRVAVFVLGVTNAGCIGPMRWAMEDALYNNNVPRQRSKAEIAGELGRSLGLGLFAAGAPANLNSPALPTAGALLVTESGQHIPPPGYCWANPNDPKDLRVAPK